MLSDIERNTRQRQEEEAVDSKKLFDRFENEGFIKQTERATVDPHQKALLNRKGNVLFNEGKIEAARRVFLTTGYSDGLTRVGDWYRKQGREIEALRMYWIAPDRTKAGELLEKVAGLIQKLIHEDDNHE
jgi:hypothetical protein